MVPYRPCVAGGRGKSHRGALARDMNQELDRDNVYAVCVVGESGSRWCASDVQGG